MKEKMIAHFARISPLSEAEQQAILDSMVVKTMDKGTLLLAAGDLASESYFILQGCVRQYYTVRDQERTARFWMEDEWVLPMESLVAQAPATYFLECVEECVLVTGDEARASTIFAQHPRLAALAQTVIERSLAEQQALAATYVTESPEERYLRILHTQPSLLQRVPQYQLASYIGVKPESLSRIRRRIIDKS